VATASDSDRLREFLHAKIAKRKKQIHREHSARLQIDSIEWVLEKIEVNKIPNDRLDGHIRTMIKDLEKRKDKAMIRSDTYFSFHIVTEPNSVKGLRGLLA
jgi:hypothetical protein